MKKEIGHKIRNLRTTAELTQEELAQRAGLTDGFISQVERGKTSLSVDSLKMILDALNVSLSEFFREERPKSVVFGANDQVQIDAGGTGKLYLLVPGATNRRFEPARLELPPGTMSDVQPAFEGDVFGCVLKGKINLTFGGEPFKVNTDEIFYFTADYEYRITNPFKRDAIVLWITSPPYF